jgi:hypothetical protein
MRQGISFSARIAILLFIALLFLFLFIKMIVIPYLSIKDGYPVDIRQKAQFHSIEAAVELFDSQFKGYPPSEGNDATGSPYCGAMKLAEAMMGQDLMGYHPKSAFRADGLDPNTLTPLYTADTLKVRTGPFLPLENANVYKLVDVYGKGKTGPFHEGALVLRDTYVRKLPGGKKAGMPILYYRARRSGTKHDPNNPDDPQNIYDYRDNLALINLGVPGDPNAVHPLANPRRFYLNTRNDKVSSMSRPVRGDSYILISAGYDGLYGTADDICNFEWHYRER